MVSRNFPQKRAKVLRSKVFARLFQKAAQVEGAKPSLPPQRRSLLDGLSLVLSLAYCSKERTETVFLRKQFNIM